MEGKREATDLSLTLRLRQPARLWEQEDRGIYDFGALKREFEAYLADESRPGAVAQSRKE